MASWGDSDLQCHAWHHPILLTNSSIHWCLIYSVRGLEVVICGPSWLQELISFIKCLSVCLEVKGNLQELVLSSSPGGTKDKTQVIFALLSHLHRQELCFVLMKEKGGAGKGEGWGRVL